MGARPFVIVLAALLTAPFVAADAVDEVLAVLDLGGEATIQSVAYAHADCVGPGLPATAAPHATHTEATAPVVIDGRIVRFSLTGLTLFGSPGPCPVTAANAGVLPQDFTGQYRMTAVCRGTLNDGTVALDFLVDMVAGIVTAQGAAGSPCSGYFGSQFHYDVTVAVDTTTFLGVELPPTGGVRLTVEQL